MLKASFLVIWIASLSLIALGAGAAPANKCVANGKVTFQQDPCPTNQARKPPTLEELNAAEKQRRATAAVAATVKPAAAAAVTSSGFSCDGRQYCSQMKSCGEAKYFLAHCPGVKMDGDRNGIPCETQWCNR